MGLVSSDIAKRKVLSSSSHRWGPPSHAPLAVTPAAFLAVRRLFHDPSSFLARVFLLACYSFSRSLSSPPRHVWLKPRPSLPGR